MDPACSQRMTSDVSDCCCTKQKRLSGPRLYLEKEKERLFARAVPWEVGKTFLICGDHPSGEIPGLHLERRPPCQATTTRHIHARPRDRVYN